MTARNFTHSTQNVPGQGASKVGQGKDIDIDILNPNYLTQIGPGQELHTPNPERHREAQIATERHREHQRATEERREHQKETEAREAQKYWDRFHQIEPPNYQG